MFPINRQFSIDSFLDWEGHYWFFCSSTLHKLRTPLVTFQLIYIWKFEPFDFLALGVHALSLLDTPMLVAIILGALFFVVAGISIYVMYTCKSREQEQQQQQQQQQHISENTRQQNYQSKTSSGNILITFN